MNLVAVASAARTNANASVYSSDNVRHLSRMELPGGGQIVIQGRYAYVGHQHRPDGTTIIDISDPRRPVIVRKLMTSHPWTHSHKVRVVGDLMVVNSEIEPGAGDRLVYPDGGFRIYDISDPFVPKEIAYFIPPDPPEWLFNNKTGDLFPGPRIGTAEDIVVDNRGNIFMDTFTDGIYVLRCTVQEGAKA